MQVQRLRTNGQLFGEHFNGGDQEYLYRDYEDDVVATIPVLQSSNSSPLALSPGKNHIEHKVSRMDTLAGIAIKYGVEVTDIRRLNGLVTDLQMFAHKTLQIPLPGRHPPSPCPPYDSVDDGEYNPTRRPGSDVMNLLETMNFKNPPEKISPAMNNLQGFYNLRSTKCDTIAEGTELAVNKTSKGYLDDEVLQKASANNNPLPNRHRKSRSLANGFSIENVGYSDEKTTSECNDNSDYERSMRRRQKADAKRSLRAPEMLLKEDTSNDFATRIAKGLALRLKSTSRTDMATPVSNATSNRNSYINNQPASVRKSMSTPSFQDSDKSSSMWATSKWTLKPEVVARPIIDVLPKPVNVRRIKTALD